jgi:hypothetical protein
MFDLRVRIALAALACQLIASLLAKRIPVPLETGTRLVPFALEH